MLTEDRNEMEIFLGKIAVNSIQRLERGQDYARTLQAIAAEIMCRAVAILDDSTR